MNHDIFVFRVPCIVICVFQYTKIYKEGLAQSTNLYISLYNTGTLKYIKWSFLKIQDTWVIRKVMGLFLQKMHNIF